jgi:hypothetical protein
MGKEEVMMITITHRYSGESPAAWMGLPVKEKGSISRLVIKRTGLVANRTAEREENRNRLSLMAFYISGVV